MTIKTIFKYIFANALVVAGLLGIVFLGIYTSMIKLPLVERSHYSYAADFADNSILMGASHHVFVGKVLGRSGSIALPGNNPGTQFTVEIIENIKGNLHGTVRVDQDGGYDHGVLSIGGDTLLPGSGYDNGYFLQPGSTYVMAVRSIGMTKDSKFGHRLISHPNSKKLISSDPKLTLDELRTLADQDEKVIALKAAYPNEVLLDADVRTGNTINSYRSTHAQ